MTILQGRKFTSHKHTPDLSTQTVVSIDIANALDDTVSDPQSECQAALFINYHNRFDVNAPILARTSLAEH